VLVLVLAGGCADFDATRGCRAPTEPGCERCLRTERGGCLEHFRTEPPGGGQAQGEGYTDARFTGQEVCPERGPACAPCMAQEEATLRRQLAPNPLGCDCTRSQDVAFACAWGAGCDCFCSHFQALRLRCGSVVEGA
jgi:hypothetical protein